MRSKNVPATRDLARRLSEAEATVHALLSGQIDAVFDAKSQTPVLLFKAQQALRESEERYRRIVETTDEGIWTIDRESIVTFANRRIATMLGYSAGAMLSKSMTSFLPDTDAARAAHRLRIERSRQGLSDENEAGFVRKDGSELWALMKTCTIRDTDGKYVGTLVMMTDNTHRMEAEAALRHERDRAERLQETSRLKGEFLANMSHELRTPLNVIIGFAQLMHQGLAGPVSDNHSEYLRDILTSSRHLLRLINDVLDLAKVESGKVALRPEEVDLTELAQETGEILRELAFRKRLRVDIHVEPDVGVILIDPSRVKQILYNYLSNAIKFTPDDGRIRVRIRLEGPTLFRIDVEDTGIGISAADLRKLFVEFQQLQAVASKEYQGTGLGLALTKRIAEALGGHVEVRSTPGEGSTFSAILPRIISAEADTPSRTLVSSSHRQPIGAGESILIVDDSAQNLSLARVVLTAAGYDVRTAGDAEEALRVLESFAPQLILMDLQLPGMDGLQLTQHLKAIPEHEGITIIALTANAMQAADQEAFAAGCAGYITKPYDIESLSRIVGEHLARRSAG